MNRSQYTNKRLLVGITFLSFIVLGIPDGLLGVAWPSIRETFGLPLDALGGLLTAFTVGFLLSSFNSGRLISLFGVGRLLLFSHVLVALGFVGYFLATSWWIMLACGCLVGFGGGMTDTGLNTYISANHSSRIVNWSHASFGLGATFGPVIMTTILGLGYSWRYGYVLVAAFKILLALSFALTLAWWRTTGPQQPDIPPESNVRLVATLKLPIVWLGITMFVLHTGIELTAGQWAYSLFTEARSVPPETAGIWIGIYWGSLTAGRVLIGFVSDHISPARLVRTGIVGILIGATLLSLNVANMLSFFGLVLIGLSIAPIFPCLISATSARVGYLHAANAIGFQISAAALGGAIVPGVTGVLAGRLGLEVIGPMLVMATVLAFGVHEMIVHQATSFSAIKVIE